MHIDLSGSVGFIVNHHVIIGLCAGHGIENADSRLDSRGLSTIVR